MAKTSTRSGASGRACRWSLAFGSMLALAVGGSIVEAQAPAMERVSFQEAIQRAIQRNPSAAVAAAGILRAEALLRQATSQIRPAATGALNWTTLNTGTEFDGSVVTPRSQVAMNFDLAMPLFAPAEWARRVQARDQVDVARLSADELRRQTALATADAYLTIIARRRAVEVNERAREVANAHYELARQLQEVGTGSRLNELRAQQEVSSDEALVESVRLAVYRAQEALGVLLAADNPVDASEEPSFEIPVASIEAAELNLAQWRTDLKLFAAEERAADRVVRDSSKDYLPSVQGLFQPYANYPSPFFLRSRGWRAIAVLSIPFYDSGQRAGAKQAREASLAEARATLTGGLTQAKSELRTARAAVESAERSLSHARAAADQARQVVDIVNVSFRAGAATNIEVIDAERRARDTDNVAAVAEDALRRARLDLLIAAGRFP